MVDRLGNGNWFPFERFENCDDRHRPLPDDEAATQGGGLVGPFLAALVPGGDGAAADGRFRPMDHPDL
jgi:hypothetical protein